jgi:SAM-dependent methyltransferase
MAQDTSFLQRVIATYASAANDKSYSEQMWPLMQDGADQTISLLDARPSARILDLACGCGSVTTALSLKGFEVTGVDCTPASLDIARRMSAQKGACVEWVCQDMRTLEYKAQFDNVCLRDVIFGIFETRDEDLDLIRRIGAALKPGGRCLFEVYNKEFALQHGVEGSLFYDQSVDRFVRRGDDRKGLSLRLYSHDEWEHMLGRKGLRIIRTDGWKWQKDPPPPPWRADLIVAQKES